MFDNTFGNHFAPHSPLANTIVSPPKSRPSFFISLHRGCRWFVVWIGESRKKLCCSKAATTKRNKSPLGSPGPRASKNSHFPFKRARLFGGFRVCFALSLRSCRGGVVRKVRDLQNVATVRGRSGGRKGREVKTGRLRRLRTNPNQPSQKLYAPHEFYALLVGPLVWRNRSSSSSRLARHASRGSLTTINWKVSTFNDFSQSPLRYGAGARVHTAALHGSRAKARRGDAFAHGRTERPSTWELLTLRRYLIFHHHHHHHRHRWAKGPHSRGFFYARPPCFVELDNARLHKLWHRLWLDCPTAPGRRRLLCNCTCMHTFDRCTAEVGPITQPLCISSASRLRVLLNRRQMKWHSFLHRCWCVAQAGGCWVGRKTPSNLLPKAAA